jgi:hypothetical protein
MELHTQETLAQLSFRDLQQTAKSLDLIAQGTRDDLTARILATQTGTIVPEDSSATTVTVDAGSFSAPEPPVEVEGDVTITAAPAEPPAPVTAPPAAKPAVVEAQPLSGAAKRYVAQMVAGYVSVDGFTKEVEDTVLNAIAAKKQPCVVKGAGNTKFEVKVFDKTFDSSNPAGDIPAKQDGVVLNLSRRLADANLLPHS